MPYLMMSDFDCDWPKAVAHIEEVDGLIHIEVLNPEKKQFFEALPDKGVEIAGRIVRFSDGKLFLNALEQVFCAGSNVFFSDVREPAITAVHQTNVA
ncbi:MAG: hypothetical protein P1P90_00330 [Patescibacteria group bacterium]|nr:hypothetical protein [Patescibacteria group bacterium]